MFWLDQIKLIKFSEFQQAIRPKSVYFIQMCMKYNELMALANLTNMSNFTIMRFWDVPKSKFDIYDAASLPLLYRYLLLILMCFAVFDS